MRSIFQVFQAGLQKTKTTLVRQIQTIFSGTKAWDDSSYDELEAALIGADLGPEISLRLVADVRDRYKRGLIVTSADIMAVAREDILRTLQEGTSRPLQLVPDGLTVVLLVGVNGGGKTTTAAKLAHLWKEDGKKVLLAAGDTFRAAAIEQLTLWSQRVGCPVVAGTQGSDAAAVAFDAVQRGLREKHDILIVDTAGRQHTRKSLMDELGKIRRTVAKACPGAPHEVWLIVDASTGTNALIQAREFGKTCEVTGLVLTKLDGTGKGGVVVPIRKELGYPVHFVGLGEKMTDLQPFDPELFARAMFE